MTKIPKKAALFEDEESGNDVNDRVKVNKGYAKEYQARKQREELKSVQFDLEDDDDASTSSSEDEDGVLLTPRIDVSIMKTINALRSKDKSIYDAKTSFFPTQDGEGEEGDDDETDSVIKRKPKRYKDVMRKQILEQVVAGEAVGDEDDALGGKTNRFAYNKEQKDIRAAFLDSVAATSDDESDDDLIVVRKKQEDVDEDEERTKQEFEAEVKKLESSTGSSNLVDPRGEVKDGESFLLDFFKKRAWMDEYSGSEEESLTGAPNDHNDDDADSIEEVDKADDFEAQYNFRFEEAAAAQSGAELSNRSYARGQTVETLRRKDETRREKRIARQERKAAERKAKEEELRRLKNAKRAEMEDKLKQIRSVLGEMPSADQNEGNVDEAALIKLLEGDFDPEKFETHMNETYGDSFYSKEDKEWKSDKDVRESLLQEEDGKMLVGQDGMEGGLYDYDEGDEQDDEDDQQGEEDWVEVGEEYYEEDTPGQNESKLEKKIRNKLMDDLYKLDYEDVIAGMPTRFKYRQVEKNSYGLSTEEILFAKDSTLKQFVSLKKMAPYREEEEYFVGSKKRRRFREMMKLDMEEEELQKEKVKESQEEDDNKVTAKKKRKRKRNKNKEADKSTSQEAAMPSAGQEEYKASAESTELDPKPKRRRRKKKINSNDATPNDESTIAAPNSATEVPLEKEKREPSIVKQESRKAKKKKKKGIGDVSGSRLSAYGL